MNVDQESLTVNEVGSKAKSKQEIYRILPMESRIFLPPSHECNYNYLRDIISGAKNHLKGNETKCIIIPSFKRLAIENIFLFADPICKLSKFLPDIKGTGSEMLCIHSEKIKSIFFIREAYNNREEVLIKKKDLRVQALSEFIHLFKKTAAFLVSPLKLNVFKHSEIGRSHYLLRKNHKGKATEIDDVVKDKLKMQIAEYRKVKIELKKEIIYLTQQVED